MNEMLRNYTKKEDLVASNATNGRQASAHVLIKKCHSNGHPTASLRDGSLNWAAVLLQKVNRLLAQ